jgi:hypothetical protein
MKLLAIALLATPALLLAQTSGAAGRFSGPVLGFVPGWNPTELQPILGVPGAARLGNPISLPNSVTQTFLAPGHWYALAAQGTSAPIAIVRLRGTAGIEQHPALTPLASAMAHPDLVAFSPGGAVAALYSQQSGRLQVFAGLPDSPRLASDISNIEVAGIARALAISDDAQALLIADASGEVYTLSPNQALVSIYHSTQVSALAFASQSHDAIVCDPVLGSAAALHLLAANAGVQTLQPPSTDGCQPQAAASTADGSTILIACPAQHLIWSVDRASGATNSYKVSGSPSALDNVGARDAFLMSPADEGGTRWLITWRPEGPVMSFIGAAHPAAEATGN